MYFKANIPRRLKFISFLFFLFLLIDILCLLYFLFGKESELTWFLYLSIAIIVAVLFIVSGVQVVGYNITSQRLEVRRRWLKISWAISDIVEIDSLNTSLGRSIRIFGIGGVLGFYGKFRHEDGRYFTAYMTDDKNSIMLRTQKGWIAISPNDRESFLADLKSVSGQLLK